MSPHPGVPAPFCILLSSTRYSSGGPTWTVFRVVCSGHGRQVICVMAQLMLHDQTSLCQASTLSLHKPLTVQTDLCEPPPLPASRRPWNIPTFLRKENPSLRSLPYGASVPGLGTCELVAFGLARLCDPAESWESSQILFQPPQLVFIAGQRHLPSVSWAKERALTLILPSGPVRRRTPSVCCSRAQGNGQGGSFSLHSPAPRTDGLHSPELSFLI